MPRQLEIELVSCNELNIGDEILLDDGHKVIIRDIVPGRNKDNLRLSLKGRPPLYVDHYWDPFMRRTKRAKETEHG